MRSAGVCTEFEGRIESASLLILDEGHERPTSWIIFRILTEQWVNGVVTYRDGNERFNLGHVYLEWKEFSASSRSYFLS